MSLTVKRLKELLTYDPDTGEFRWRQKTGRARAGDVAGFSDIRVGVQIRVDTVLYLVLYLAHRLAWLYMTGDWPAEEVDHEDVNRLNNRWHNLRAATHAQNQHNIPVQKNNKLGVKGVVHVKGYTKPYWARLMLDRIVHDLGRYTTVEEAGEAYRLASLKYHGDFARVSI